MDFDFGINRNEKKSIFNSVANAMTSMKEAKAEKIYRRIQKEGMTKYSKPQVDRALAKALNYGIFELRNNNVRVTDNILDDEDTIYWRAQIKQEDSPSRLQGGDYINPEKDRRTFRRLPIFANSRRVTDKKQKVVSFYNRNKRNNTKNSAGKETGKIKKNNKQSTRQGKQCKKYEKKTTKKSNTKKGSKAPAQKPKEKRMPQKVIRKMTLKDAKKITRDPKGVHDIDTQSKYLKLYEKLYSGDKSNTDSLSTLETDHDYIDNGYDYKTTSDYNEDYVNRDSGHENDDVEDCDSDPNDDDGMSYDEDDQCECECECDNNEYRDTECDSCASEEEKSITEHNCSSFIDYMRYTVPSDMTLSTVKETSKNTKNRLKRKISYNNSENRFDLRECSLCPDENLDSLHETSNWNIDDDAIENNIMSEVYGNTDWMSQNLQTTYNREIRQFDNALKIEPFDLSPFKNIGEASYIS